MSARDLKRTERLILIDRDVVDQVVDPRRPGSIAPRKTWVGAYVALLYGAGIGTEEALTLRRSCYRPQDGVIVVPERPAILSYHPVDWRAREVPLLPRVREVVDAYLGSFPAPDGNDLLITDPTGTLSRSKTFRAVAEAMVGVGVTGVDPVRIRDAYLRAVWAHDRGHGHGECLIGIQRAQYGLGARASSLPDLADLAAFLHAAHPWGASYRRASR